MMKQYNGFSRIPEAIVMNNGTVYTAEPLGQFAPTKKTKTGLSTIYTETGLAERNTQTLKVFVRVNGKR